MTEATPESTPQVSVHTVVSAMLDEMPTDKGHPEKIELRCLHSRYYVGRIYYPNTSDYDGFAVQLEDPS